MLKIISLLLSTIIMYSVKAQNVGIGTTTPTARLHVTDSSVLFSGSSYLPSTPNKPPISGEGKRTMWYADKAAFRTGFVTGANWDKDSIGNYSFASGRDTKAMGLNSTSIGMRTTASGDFSISMGNNSKASGDYSTSMGSATQASGHFSTSMGSATQASGHYSTSMGEGTRASGDYSTSMGYYTIASGESSTSLGYVTQATGHHSTSMGAYTIASGQYSTSMGEGTRAIGIYSTSLGYNTIAKSNSSLVIGTFNDTIYTNNRLFEIGNGIAYNARSNAVTVLGNGNVGIGTTNPTVSLDIEGGIRTKYSGSQVISVAGGTSLVNITTTALPIGWDFANTMVIVTNVDGQTGTIYQAKLTSLTNIQLIFNSNAAAANLARFNYIVFKF